MTAFGRVAGPVLRRFRSDLVAILVVAAGMALVVDHAPPAALETVSNVVPFLGIVVAIFIGFRNRNAYARWWEARTLWTGIAVNGRSLDYALIAYEDGTPQFSAVADRMRRREVRHAWTLAAELQGGAAVTGLADLTPEDPQDCTATELLTRQGADVGALSQAGLIDRQARRVLVTINSAQVNTAAGLERIRHQPIPPFYDVFVRSLAWFFAVIVCSRMTGHGYDKLVAILLGVLIIGLVIVAERIGSLLDEPMSGGVFGLPLYRYCAELTTDLLGPDHPLASPAQAGGDKVPENKVPSTIQNI